MAVIVPPISMFLAGQSEANRKAKTRDDPSEGKRVRKRLLKIEQSDRKRERRIVKRVRRKSRPARKLTFIERLASLPFDARQRVLASFTSDEIAALEYNWKLWARDNQRQPEGTWDIWLVESGRGFGKTRTGAETVREWVESGVMRIALIGRTADDVRSTMIEEGILQVFPAHQRPNYEPSKRKITFHTGCIARIFTAEEPDIPRGKQQEKAWFDELSSFENMKEVFDNVMFGLRIGKRPQVIVTTTPKPRREYRELFKSKKSKYAKLRVKVTKGSSYDNISNLSEVFISSVIKPYEGTRLGRQELHGEFLEDSDGALWTSNQIDRYRVPDVRLDMMAEVVVAVDPSVSFTEDSNKCGIVIVGKHRDGHAYVLGDWTIHAPAVTKVIQGETVVGWAQHAVEAYFGFDCDVMVGEVNNGGDLVEAAIAQVNRDRVSKSPETIVFEQVRASKGKQTRAEPIAILYDKGIIHHVQSADLDELEEQMTTWEPGTGEESPDRLDALVWALTYLYLGTGGDFEVLSKASNWKGILK